MAAPIKTDKPSTTNLATEPWQREGNYLSLAIAMAVILGVAAIPAFVWSIVLPADLQTMKQRVDVLAPFGFLGVALITFSTVVWRGLISARQADTGLRQLEGLRRQIDLSEETNLANLLQKGVELISEKDDVKQIAGITSLGVVARSLNRIYSESARNLLVDHVIGGQDDMYRPTVKAAVEALNGAVTMVPYVLSRSIKFESSTDVEGLWLVLRGIHSQHYEGGSVRGVDFANYPEGNMRFNGTEFFNCSTINSGRVRATKSEFSYCDVTAASLQWLEANEFYACDFSGCHFIFASNQMPNLTNGKNFYLRSNPPTFLNAGTGIDDNRLIGVDSVVDGLALGAKVVPVQWEQI